MHNTRPVSGGLNEAEHGRGVTDVLCVCSSVTGVPSYDAERQPRKKALCRVYQNNAVHTDAQGVRLRYVSSEPLRHILPSLAHLAFCTGACFGFPKVCMCDSGGPFRSRGPPLCPRGSPKSWPSQKKVTRAHPHIIRHCRPRIWTSILRAGTTAARTAPAYRRA